MDHSLSSHRAESSPAAAGRALVQNTHGDANLTDSIRPSYSVAGKANQDSFRDIVLDETPPSVPSSSAVKLEQLVDDAPTVEPVRVHAVLLVSFDHTLGPIIEFGYPQAFQDDADLNRDLPFLALPDGSHAREEDYSYFHILQPSLAPSTIFGISCNRQIPATDLLTKDKNVTRSTVQKAIVVLANKPIFGALRDKLGVITRTFFAQRDFADKSILVDLYTSFEFHQSLQSPMRDQENERTEMYMGTSLRELVHKFRGKTLMLLKLLLLQRRVMFYSATTSVESLCTFQYSLVALIPALLTNLQDAATPTLSRRAKTLKKPSSLKTSDKASLIRYLGLPLDIFGRGAFFQPYLPLQQIELLQAKTYLVGTTNSIFQQQRDCRIDVIVKIELGTLDVLEPKLSPLLHLTAADRKWMDEIVSIVDNSYNAEDPSRPAAMGFIGSEDFLRAKFEEYICSLLACIKLNDFLAGGDKAGMLLSGNELASYNMSSFNEGFVRSFKQTSAFKLWDQTTDSAIFDLVEPKHPMEGKTNPLEDVGIRLAAGLHDLHLQENLAPTREAISRGLSTGSESLMGAYTALARETSKLQSQFHERRASYHGGSATPTTPAATEYAPPIGSALLAGVDVAKNGAATLATGIGSFFQSRRGIFGSKPPPDSLTLPPASGLGVDRSASSPNSTSPSPSRSPADPITSFLRPLATAPSATSPTGSTTSLSTSPTATLAYPPTNASRSPSPASASLAAGVGGFFGNLRWSFIEGANTASAPTPSQSTSAVAPIAQGPQLKELGLINPATAPRDLDAEYAAKEERARKRRERELALAEAKLNGTSL